MQSASVFWTENATHAQNPTRSLQATRPVSFLNSVAAGSIHLLRKLLSRQFFTILQRFRTSVTDESVLTMIRAHRDIVDTIEQSGARALTARYPNYSNKYITNYLAKSFGTKSRREILKFHHNFLSGHVIASFYEQILNDRPVLWSETLDGTNFSISMSFNEGWHSEGDISLTFDRNNTPVYEISFSIVPGHLVHCSANEVALIGRIQGRKGEAEQIRISTKACHDIAPSHLLLAAVHSIAEVLEIDAVGGVSNEQQLAKSVHDAAGCYFDYNAFLETHLFQKTVDDIYVASIPFLDRTTSHLSSSHRRRALNKRRQKQKIAECVGATFARRFKIRVRPAVTDEWSLLAQIGYIDDSDLQRPAN